MRIRISKLKMRDAVKLTASAADKKGTIPILSNILLEAEDNLLRLTATNLEVGISTVVDCSVEKEGKTTINANKATKLFSSLTGNEITLETDDSKLVVRSANSRFSLATLPSDEFPEIELPENFTVKLPSDEIDRALKKVSYAASTDEARYILTGVLLRSLGDRLHAVATDGHRLALYEVFVPSEEFSAILPKKSLSELKKVLREGEEVGFVELNNKLFLRSGDTVMWTSLIEGEYPDYLSVIPENNPVSFFADKEELLSALKEVSIIFDKEEVRAVVFNLNGSNLILNAKKLEGESSEEAEVTIPVDYSGEPFTISFNIVHMIESISSFDASSIKFQMSEPLSPVLITSDEETRLKNVVMPMKI
ncbi:MAG: DNA polymerase III subunit beta [Thermovibrio sp.]|nr:MAG: DNA polymerase III subunit beta [Thermovibrio sp.]